MRARASPLKGESQFHMFLWALWMISHLFSCQVFWGLFFLVQIPRAGVPRVRHKSLAPLRKMLNWGDPSLLCVTMLTVGFGRTVKYGLSYLPWCGPFIFCHGAAVHLVYRSFSEETDAYVTTPERGGSSIFLCCHLEPNNYCFNLQPQLLWQPGNPKTCWH